MKKIVLIVFCAAILLCANSANAQTTGVSTMSISSDGSLVAKPMAGGEWSISIVVTDSKSSPIVNALVSIPATGQSNQYTNTSGTVEFDGGGTCPCTNCNVAVTVGGTLKNTKIATCGTYTVTFP